MVPVVRCDVDIFKLTAINREVYACRLKFLIINVTKKNIIWAAGRRAKMPQNAKCICKMLNATKC